LVFGLQTAGLTILRRHNLVYKAMLGESAIVNPETFMDWKSKELLKIVDRYQMKDIFNVDETGLFYNLQPSNTTHNHGSCDSGTKSEGSLFC
jgi:hypothetical protein